MDHNPSSWVVLAHAPDAIREHAAEIGPDQFDVFEGDSGHRSHVAREPTGVHHLFCDLVDYRDLVWGVHLTLEEFEVSQYRLVEVLDIVRQHVRVQLRLLSAVNVILEQARVLDGYPGEARENLDDLNRVGLWGSIVSRLVGLEGGEGG